MLGDQPDAEALLAEVLAKDPTVRAGADHGGLLQDAKRPAAPRPSTSCKRRMRRRRPHRHTANLGELYIRDGEPQKALDLALAKSRR